MPMRNITMAEWSLIKKIRATGDCGCGAHTDQEVAAAVAQVAAESTALREEPVDDGVPEPAADDATTPTEGAPLPDETDGEPVIE